MLASLASGFEKGEVFSSAETLLNALQLVFINAEVEPRDVMDVLIRFFKVYQNSYQNYSLNSDGESEEY
ncbi:hypothetical protein [Ligilactobacillus equi]|uniref:Uncharacterized protein n=1 Tax=Ligilactobacillus equi DSM 15833 = JCM 10991 TaxID=1423740 RepID=A0A0R1TAE5_9LACO|nr:hypothetical protein [Ligilactobacillus equi]KRL78252.1 hypothetical protein FC36_GL001141 [Ligilactobacillus equi DSM 15833 = JCM 10991]